MAGECETLEFKTTRRIDLRVNRISRAGKRATVKTSAGILSHRARSLLRGIDDVWQVVCIETDDATFYH